MSVVGSAKKRKGPVVPENVPVHPLPVPVGILGKGVVHPDGVQEPVLGKELAGSRNVPSPGAFILSPP